MPEVAVFGAGVAGLTAAHELASRGHAVTVYEERAQIGGKSRTQWWTKQGTAFPGEHGFRFFPTFYWHVTEETMRRIPLDAGSADPAQALAPYAPSVYQNLTPISVTGIGKNDLSVMTMPRTKIQGADDLVDLMVVYFQAMQVGFLDALKMAWRLFPYYLLGDKRRWVYDSISFWDFMDAGSLGAKAQEMLRKTPKSLVAMSSTEGNARTLANMSYLMMQSYGSAGPSEHVLNGPTSKTWIDPWRKWLEQLGVKFETGALDALTLDPGSQTIAGAQVSDHGTVTADCYVVAVPLERAEKLITADLAACCPELAKLRNTGSGASPPDWLDPDWALAWMVGAQFYLHTDVPIVKGHVAFVDSEWALTGVSQAQFWAGDYASTWGNGAHKGVLSLIASDWKTKGPLFQTEARDCSRDQVLKELLHQAGRVLTEDGTESVLAPANVADIHLDADLVWNAAETSITANHSRLLIHPPASGIRRPAARTAVRNLSIAGDYVLTQIDLATMEGANEAGRMAAVAALDCIGHSAGDRPELRSPLAQAEPDWLKTLKAIDDALYDAGKPSILPVPTPQVELVLEPEFQSVEPLRTFERAARELSHTLDPADPPLDVDLGEFPLGLLEGHPVVGLPPNRGEEPNL